MQVLSQKGISYTIVDEDSRSGGELKTPLNVYQANYTITPKEFEKIIETGIIEEEK